MTVDIPQTGIPSTKTTIKVTYSDCSLYITNALNNSFVKQKILTFTCNIVAREQKRS